MIALSVANLKMFSPESEIFLWIKPKKKKNFFVESLDQCRRLEVCEKARNVFCDEPVRLSDHKVLRNLIKQLFHSRLLDMRLVIAISALRVSLAIYHVMSNAHSWNDC